MTYKFNSHDAKVLAAGAAVGGTAVTLVLTKVFNKMFSEKVTENTLKNQFITWLITTGIHLPEPELYKAAQIEWDFITQVTTKK